MLLPDNVFLPDWFAIPFTLIAIVGVTNAINLSDGLDGLAGGISLLSFICIGCLAYCSANIVIALLSIAVVGAILGFLRFNTYPAVMFMGDAGSQLLGFLAVTLSLALTQGNTSFTPLLPLILLGFPVLDTLTVMFERVAGGKSPFVADKNHFHHKLIRLGLYHTEAVLVIYIFQAFLVTSAFVFRFYPEWFLLIFYIIFSTGILSGFFVAKKRGWKFKRYDLADVKTVGIEILDFPQFSGDNKFFELDDCGVILKDMAHHQDHLILFCQFDQILPFLFGQRKRFLHEDVLSCKKAFFRQIIMVFCGGSDDHRFNRRGRTIQQVIKISASRNIFVHVLKLGKHSWIPVTNRAESTQGVKIAN